MSASETAQVNSTPTPALDPQALAQVVRALRILAVKVDQRLASQAGLAAVLALMPGAALINPAAAGRIAASLIPETPETEPVRKLAAVHAMTLVRMAQAMRVRANQAAKQARARTEAAPAAAAPPQAGATPEATHQMAAS